MDYHEECGKRAATATVPKGVEEALRQHAGRHGDVYPDQAEDFRVGYAEGLRSRRQAPKTEIHLQAFAFGHSEGEARVAYDGPGTNVLDAFGRFLSEHPGYPVNNVVRECWVDFYIQGWWHARDGLRGAA